MVIASRFMGNFLLEILAQSTIITNCTNIFIFSREQLFKNWIDSRTFFLSKSKQTVYGEKSKILIITY